MRRLLLLLLMLLAGMIMVGCSSDQEGDGPATGTTPEIAETTDMATSPPQPAATDTLDSTPLLKPTIPEPSSTAVESSTETPVPATLTIQPSPTALPQLTFHDLSITDDDIFFFPVPELIAGDPVSIQVMPTIPRGLAPNDVDVRILVDGQELVTGNLNWRKLSGDTVGLYQWVWDTVDQAGEHTVTAILDPLDLIQIGRHLRRQRPRAPRARSSPSTAPTGPCSTTCSSRARRAGRFVAWSTRSPARPIRDTSTRRPCRSCWARTFRRSTSRARPVAPAAPSSTASTKARWQA